METPNSQWFVERDSLMEDRAISIDVVEPTPVEYTGPIDKTMFVSKEYVQKRSAMRLLSIPERLLNISAVLCGPYG